MLRNLFGETAIDDSTSTFSSTNSYSSPSQPGSCINHANTFIEDCKDEVANILLCLVFDRKLPAHVICIRNLDALALVISLVNQPPKDLLAQPSSVSALTLCSFGIRILSELLHWSPLAVIMLEKLDAVAAVCQLTFILCSESNDIYQRSADVSGGDDAAGFPSATPTVEPSNFSQPHICDLKFGAENDAQLRRTVSGLRSDAIHLLQKVAVITSERDEGIIAFFWATILMFFIREKPSSKGCEGGATRRGERHYCNNCEMETPVFNCYEER